MGTSYPGYQSFTPVAQPSGQGRFISGMAADDGDNDDAAHLMALAMACMDNCQFLGWRMLDIVSGATYTWTATINLKNTFNWTGGAVKFTGTGKLEVLVDGSMIAGGATLVIGDGSLGVGHIAIRRGSDILADGSLGSSGTADIGAKNGNARVVALDGADVLFDENASIDLYGGVILGNTSGDNFTLQRHLFTKSGQFAVTKLRRGKPAGWDGDINFDPTEWDLIEVGLPSADRTWTFSAPPAGASDYIEVRVRPITASPGAHKILITDQALTQIAQIDFSQAGGPTHTLGSLLIASVDDGSGNKRWRVIQVSGDLCSDSILF